MNKRQAQQVKKEAEDLGYRQIATMQAVYHDGSRGWEVIMTNSADKPMRVASSQGWDKIKAKQG